MIEFFKSKFNENILFQGYDNESRPHPNQHVSNAYHQQAGHVRNQQYPYNNNNTNTRYLPAENGFINTNNVMMQRNDQGGFDAPHIQNGYVNQRNPPSQCKNFLNINQIFNQLKKVK